MAPRGRENRYVLKELTKLESKLSPFESNENIHKKNGAY